MKGEAISMILRLLGRISCREEGGLKSWEENQDKKGNGDEYQVVGNFRHPCFRVKWKLYLSSDLYYLYYIQGTNFLECKMMIMKMIMIMMKNFF